MQIKVKEKTLELAIWFKLLHRFFVTTGFVALVTIMCSAATEKTDIHTPSMASESCESKSWIDELLYLPNTKKNFFCPDLDKFVSQNNVFNK